MLILYLFLAQALWTTVPSFNLNFLPVPNGFPQRGQKSVAFGHLTFFSPMPEML
jgi:hypothetical protein